MSHPASVILMYHRVVDVDLDPWGMCVSPDNFDAQLAAIRRVAEPLSMDGFLAASRAGTLPPRSVVVTFDDGSLDNLQHAYPALQRHAIPAMLYVTTANLGSEREFWWDRLETLLLVPDQLPARLSLSLPSGDVAWDLGDCATYTPDKRAADDETPAWSARPGTRLRFYYEVWKALWPLPDEVREPYIDAVAEWAGRSPPDISRRSLDEDELRAIAATGLVSIGAHTIHHPPLPAHALDVQRAEILGSQARLQEILGHPVTSFAYPHGEHSAETIALLQEAGFDSAVTVVQRMAAGDSDPMRLPRYGVKDTDGATFEAELRRRFEQHEALAAGG